MKKFKKRLVTMWLVAAMTVLLGAAGYVIRPGQIKGAEAEEKEYSSEAATNEMVPENTEQDDTEQDDTEQDNKDNTGMSSVSLKELIGDYCVDAVSKEIIVDGPVRISDILTKEQQIILVKKLIECGKLQAKDEKALQVLCEETADTEALLSYKLTLKEEDRKQLINWMMQNLENFEGQILKNYGTISEEELISYVNNAFEDAIAQHAGEIVFNREFCVTDEELLSVIIDEVSGSSNLPNTDMQEIIADVLGNADDDSDGDSDDTATDVADDAGGNLNKGTISSGVTEEDIEVIVQKWSSDIGAEFSRKIQYYADRIEEIDTTITGLKGEQDKIADKISELENEKNRISELNTYIEQLEDKTQYSIDELEKETEENLTGLRTGLEKLIEELSADSSQNALENDFKISELKKICEQLNTDKASEISLDLLESELRELIDGERMLTNESTDKLAASILENVNRLEEIESEYAKLNNSVQKNYELLQNEITQSSNNLSDSIVAGDDRLNRQIGDLEKLFGNMDALLTSEKGDIVSAINEVFQYAGEGKRKITEALNQSGVTRDTSDTFQSLADGISEVAINKFNTGILSADARCNTDSVSYKNGYSEGKNDGYSNGYTEGKNDGYTSGYTEGFDDGKATCKVEIVDLFDLRSEGQTWMHTISYNVGKGYKQVYCQIDYTWISGSSNRFMVDYEYDPDTGVLQVSVNDWEMNEIAFYCGEQYTSTKLTIIALQ